MAVVPLGWPARPLGPPPTAAGGREGPPGDLRFALVSRGRVETSPMQVHNYSVEVDGSPQEVWQLFWGYRKSRPEHDGVKIDILHPGDEVGEGLIRHCKFRVPRYLMTGGVGYSWEWLTEVTPYESWKYDAIGKPLWSVAEGRTRFEELPGERTRIHFSETYHAFNPVDARPSRAAGPPLHLQGQRPSDHRRRQRRHPANCGRPRRT